MSFSEEITARRASPTSLFHSFRTSSVIDSKFHLFVEGYEDSFFYGRFLRDNAGGAGNQWKTYICFGKKNMERVIGLFQGSSFSNRDNVLFLRDSDFDRFLGNVTESRHMLLTCGYAVENYVCTRDVVTEFMINTLCISADEVNLYEITDRHFNLVDRLFAWMAPTIGAALQAVSLGTQLDLDKLDVVAMYKQLRKTSSLPDAFSEAEISNAGLHSGHFNDDSRTLGNKFVEQDAVSWLRGKYLLECTGAFLAAERERLLIMHKSKQISCFNRRSSPDYSPAILFERLSSFASAPERIKAAFASRVLPAGG